MSRNAKQFNPMIANAVDLMYWQAWRKHAAAGGVPGVQRRDQYIAAVKESAKRAKEVRRARRLWSSYLPG